MIFAARDILVSLAFFAILYAALSSLAVILWRSIRYVRRESFSCSANFLFGLRIIPLEISVIVTMFFTLPSFWMMERPSLDEDAETFLLALCALVIIGAGLFRVWKAHGKTRRAVAEWTRGLVEGDRFVACTSTIAPPLVLVGVCKPRVIVSETAKSVLSHSEMRVAIQHELKHKDSGDNLKKFLLSAMPFPGMESLDRAWREAAELAADHAAVTNRREALDLAAALIKLSRFIQQQSIPPLVTGLVAEAAFTTLRVECLLRWNGKISRSKYSRILSLILMIITIALIAANYETTLALTHRLTEILVPDKNFRKGW